LILADFTGFAVFEMKTLRKISRTQAHYMSGVDAFRLSADGRTLVVSDDGQIQLWNVPDLKLLATVQILTNDGHWFASTPDGLYDGTPGIANQIDVRLGDQVFPMSLFDKRLHYRGLVDALLAGRRPRVPPDISLAPAPDLKP
jgi:hypothetical protein